MRRPILLLCLLLCAACGQQAIGDTVALAEPRPTQTTALPATVASYDTLLAALRAFSEDTAIEDDVSHQFLTVTGKSIRLDNQRLQAYEYPDSASAAAEAARFSRDGAWIEQNGTHTLVNWIATPHLYRSEKLLVVYVGDDASMLDLLENMLGQEFAGGANPYAVAMRPAP